MIRKLIAFAAAALFSMSASAGYIQYTLNNVTFSDGAWMDGYFVQDTRDNSIAYYEFQTGAPGYDRLFPSGTYSRIESAYTYGWGPTSFTVSDTLSTSYWHTISLDINWSRATGEMMVNGWDSAQPAPETNGWPGYAYYYRQIASGTVVAGAADPALVAALEDGYRYVNHLVPHVVANPVPEPGSLALIGVGAFALAGLRRRWSGMARGTAPA